MKKVKKTKNIVRTTLIFALMAAVLVLAAPAVLAVESSQGTQPEIVTGAKRLVEDALNWILVLVPVCAGLMVAYHAWMKSMADGDQGVIAERNRKMKNTIVGAVIAESASGLCRFILSYF